MKERRAARRYRLALPLLISRVPHFKEFQPLYGRTRDMSIQGVYFTLDQELPLGAKFDFSLRLPQGTQVLIDAQARVVRVQTQRRNTAKRVGLAARIEKYKLIQPEPRK